MSEAQATYDGHRFKGCKGEWINISSLAEQQWTCPLCHALIPSPDLIGEPVTPPAEQPIGMLGMAPRAMLIIAGAAIGAVVAAGIVLFLLHR